MKLPAFRDHKLVYILAALFVVLLIGAIIRGSSKPKATDVTAEKVSRHTIHETVSASGKIFPETEVKLASDVSGEITELFVKEGDSVTAGQILGRIRPDQYASAVERGEAAVKSAESQREISASQAGGSVAQIEQLRAEKQRVAAQLETAKSNFKRAEQLLKEGVMSQADYDNAKANMAALEAGLNAADAGLRASESSAKGAEENIRMAGYGVTSARASLKEFQTSLRKTNIVAPVSGIVSKLNVEKGERVVGTLQMAGTEMMRVANLHSMEVQVEVSENDILKVKVGHEADIEVDAYLGRKFKGKVSEIANSASNVGGLAGGLAVNLNTDQVTNFVVKVRIDPKSYLDLLKNGQRYPFRPGMSASVDIQTHTSENVLAVPITCVTVREADGKKLKKETAKNDESNLAQPERKKEDELKEIVFLVSGDTVAIREVKTGVQDNDNIEIISGLQEGEMLVTGPYSAVARKLERGGRIKIVTEEQLKKKDSGGIKIEVD